jgi:tetratricopeptide (TPR) repeat protein
MVTAAGTPRARAGARYALPFAGIALVASLLAPAECAFAQSPPGASGTSVGLAAASSQPQADALFAEGRDLLEKGKYPEACAKLARSEELAPAVGTLLNLAYCYEQLGKLRSAMDAYGEAERLANVAGEPKRAAFARERYAAVEPRAPKLVVRVVPPEAPGLEVKRNGTPLAKSDLDRPIAVDPQDYLISASAPGYVGWKGAIIVRGEAAVVTVVVPPLEAAITTAPAVAAPTSPIGIRRIAALGFGAVSAVAIGAGIGAGLGAKSRYDDARSHCDATGCDETGASIQRGAVGQGNLATALIALGVLAGAGGIYLWIIGAPDEKPAQRPVMVDPSPLRSVLGGRF